jgi:hypothetical protein
VFAAHNEHEHQQKNTIIKLRKIGKIYSNIHTEAMSFSTSYRNLKKTLKLL